MKPHLIIKRIFLGIGILIGLLVFFVSWPTGAREVAYPNYTFNFWHDPVPAPQAYMPLQVIELDNLGVGDFRDPSDLVTDSNDNTYILDTRNNRVIYVNSAWEVIRVISGFENNDHKDTFRNPQGIFVTEQGNLYVADTDNARIVELNSDGQLVRVIETPVTEQEGVFASDFVYRPRKLVVDPLGRIFVIARHVYEGILEFHNNGQFKAFLGAPRVTPSAADLFWSRISTEAQLQRSALFLPTEYENLTLDMRGFLLVTEKDQLKRLNPSGFEIMKSSNTLGDFQEETRSLFIDIAPRKHGGFTVLDRRQGRVFTYDAEQALLYVFGGIGTTEGTFRSPAAISVINDDKIIVLDSRLNTATIFAPTQFGQLIHAAIDYHQSGQYDLAFEAWGDILRRNANYDLAYSRMGRLLLSQDRFAEAMQMYHLGNDRVGYGKAFALHRREVIANIFGPLMTCLVVIILCLYVAAKVSLVNLIRRFLARQISAKGWGQSGGWRNLRQLVSSLWYAGYVIFHPFDGFWDLKHEKRGNPLSATIMLVFVIITYTLMRQYTGFLFNTVDVKKINLYIEVASVLLPFALWCVINWAITTLMEGKGTLTDIYVSTAYALTPIVLINIPLIVVSNYMLYSEGSFYYALMSFAVVWTVALLVLSSMMIHDYGGAKTLATGGLTLVGMGTVLFLSLLFFNVVALMYGFGLDLYKEVFLRY